MSKKIVVDTVTITKEQLDAADTSQTIALFEVPPNDYIVDVFARVKTAFAGVTYPQVYIGDANDDDKYIKVQPINKAGDLLRGVAAEQDNYCNKIPVEWSKSYSGKTIYGTFSSSATNFASLSAGEMEVVLVRVTNA